MTIGTLASYRIDWRFLLAFPLGVLLTTTMIMVSFVAFEASNGVWVGFDAMLRALLAVWVTALLFSPLVFPGTLLGWAVGWSFFQKNPWRPWVQTAACGACAGLFALLNFVLIFSDAEIVFGGHSIEWFFSLAFVACGALVAVWVYGRDRRPGT